MGSVRRFSEMSTHTYASLSEKQTLSEIAMGCTSIRYIYLFSTGNAPAAS